MEVLKEYMVFLVCALLHFTNGKNIYAFAIKVVLSI